MPDYPVQPQCCSTGPLGHCCSKLTEPINVNNDDEHYKALEARQEAYTKNYDTHKDCTFLYAGCTVVVQMEDMGSWTHGTIVEGNIDDH